MKAADVQRIVHAIGDAHAARAAAVRLEYRDDDASVRQRLTALEAAFDVIAEVMLAGTSADPGKAGKR